MFYSQQYHSSLIDFICALCFVSTHQQATHIFRFLIGAQVINRKAESCTRSLLDNQIEISLALQIAEVDTFETSYSLENEQ